MKCTHALGGRNTVVTGSSQGIGRAVAMALAAEGARVVVNGRSGDAVGEVVDEIGRGGGKAVACVGSVTDFEFAGALVECCRASFGSIDVLVNCAGIGEPPGRSILDIPPEAWQRLIDVHLGGTFNTCRQAAPRMAEQGGGSIVNTSSHAFSGTYGGTGYPAAKGATNSLTFAMAAELREHGVRVNAVCPGARTRLSAGPDNQARIRDLHARDILDDFMRDASLNPAEPEHVGALYAFLASDLASDITGRLFSASGGYVGLFATGSETPLAYRDHEVSGAWTLDELSAALRGSPHL